jgi:hypothetical protein
MYGEYFCERCTYFAEHHENGYIGVCGAEQLPTAEKTSCVEFLARVNDSEYIPPLLVILPPESKTSMPMTNFWAESIVANLIALSINPYKRYI